MRVVVPLAAIMAAAVWCSPSLAQSASADFNGDGYADLAVGVPSEDVMLLGNVPNAGAVNVFYGSRTGLSETGAQTLGQGGEAEVGDDDNFGAALAAGDFNGDGFDDLAIGVPGENVDGVVQAGAVAVVYGSSVGLRTSTGIPEIWHQNSGGVNDEAEAGDRFGSVLVAANFGKGSRADLAVGVPFENEGVLGNTGTVNILYGRSGGLSATGNQVWHQNATGIADVAEPNDNFGAALAAANLGKSGHADLAVGVPSEDFYGAVADGGAVNVIYGTSNGLSAAGDQFWHQDSAGIANSVEEDDRFGDALAASNFGKSAYADLAVGAPTESLGSVAAGGAVNVIYGTSIGLSAAGDQFWHQDSSGIADAAEEGDRFAFAVAAANFGKSSQADLAIGVPQEDLAVGEAGAVNVIYGSSTGLAAAGDQLWHQDANSVMDVAEIGDAFGRSLGAGNFGSSSHADLAAGVPFEDVGPILDAGAVNLIFGTSTGLSGFGDEFWHQDSPGAPDSAEQDDIFGSALAR